LTRKSGVVLSVLTFAVSRSHAGSDLDAAVRRFADALGGVIGRRVVPTVTRDYEKLLEGVLVGGVAIAWLPPLIHARAARSGAVLACVSERGGALTYRAALLVRRDSDYATVRDLRGTRAAWADPFSASGYTFPRLHVLEAGIDPRRAFSLEGFHGSASRACQAVADGVADVCAHFLSDAAAGDEQLARLELRRALGEPVADALRVLAVTNSIPPDGIVLAPPLDGMTQAIVRDALLSLDRSPQGRAAIRALLNADRLAPVTADVARLIDRARAVLASRA
jgi:phosphate/phosphite/phosphonate ABC transporter binding protein